MLRKSVTLGDCLQQRFQTGTKAEESRGVLEIQPSQRNSLIKEMCTYFPNTVQ
jgi:hypothetical protein